MKGYKTRQEAKAKEMMLRYIIPYTVAKRAVGITGGGTIVKERWDWWNDGKKQK